MRGLLVLLLALIGVGGLARAAPAQEAQSLADFVAEVARRWAAGDAEAIVALAPRDGTILLDLGERAHAEVGPRNAAAALRRVFAERETVSVHAARATLSGGVPPQGFGELTWSGRARGVAEIERVTVYVGVVLEGSRWRVRELRILR